MARRKGKRTKRYKGRPQRPWRRSTAFIQVGKLVRLRDKRVPGPNEWVMEKGIATYPSLEGVRIDEEDGVLADVEFYMGYGNVCLVLDKKRWRKQDYLVQVLVDDKVFWVYDNSLQKLKRPRKKRW